MVVVTWVMHLATASRMAQTTAATTEQGTVDEGAGGGGGGGGGGGYGYGGYGYAPRHNPGNMGGRSNDWWN